MQEFPPEHINDDLQHEVANKTSSPVPPLPRRYDSRPESELSNNGVSLRVPILQHSVATVGTDGAPTAEGPPVQGLLLSPQTASAEPWTRSTPRLEGQQVVSGFDQGCEEHPFSAPPGFHCGAHRSLRFLLSLPTPPPRLDAHAGYQSRPPPRLLDLLIEGRSLVLLYRESAGPRGFGSAGRHILRSWSCSPCCFLVTCTSAEQGWIFSGALFVVP